MKEIWRNVPNFKGLYKISNFGRVASLDRTLIYKNGVHHHIHGKIKKPSKNKDGTLVVALYKHQKGHNLFISRLVAKAFLPNPKQLPIVCHINNDLTDNKVTNLKWCPRATTFTKYTSEKLKASHYQRVRLIKNHHHYDFNSMRNAAVWIKKQTKAKGKIKTIVTDISRCCQHQVHRDGKGVPYVCRSAYGFKAEYLGKDPVSKRLKQPKNETWKTIPNYSSYQVSNYGNVRSKPRTKVASNGVIQHYKSRVMRTYDSKAGYKIVTLCKNNKTKHFFVHRLVAQAFIPNPHHYSVVNHKDENTRDNKASNLEWCTETYNNNYGDKSAKDRVAHVRPITLTKFGKTYRFPSVQLAARWLKNKVHTKAKIKTIHGHLEECCNPKETLYQHIYGFTARRA